MQLQLISALNSIKAGVQLTVWKLCGRIRRGMKARDTDSSGTAEAAIVRREKLLEQESSETAT